MSDQSKMKIAYSISERNGKSFFNRIGVAFVNRDGSITVKLEALPVNGEIMIRDYVQRDETGSSARKPSVSARAQDDDNRFELNNRQPTAPRVNNDTPRESEAVDDFPF